MTRRDNTQTILHFLSFVRIRGTVTMKELMEQFGPGTPDDLSIFQIRDAIVHRMVNECSLLPSGATHTRRWALHPMQIALDAKEASARRAAALRQASVRRGPPPAVVPPRTYNTMGGPLYHADPIPCHRPGAMDFARLPSFGDRC